MECCNPQDLVGLHPAHGRDHKMMRRPLFYQPTYSLWFDTRVFYVRLTSCFMVDDDSTPDHLTISYFPLGVDTVVKVNGGRNSNFSDSCVSTQLRRDRADRMSEEATYVSTDNVSISGTVCFEVCNRDEMLLSGVLELSGVDGRGSKGTGEKRWGIKCESHMMAAAASARGGSIFKGRPYMGLENRVPTVDIYVAGTFCGSPVILTETLQLFSPRKKHKKVMRTTLDTIPEYETTERKNHMFLDALQVPCQYGDVKQDNCFNADYDPKSMYHLSDADYLEIEDNGELSWFNAGVRVGVGISLGLCVGVGLGLGLLVSSYQTTARNLKRRFF